MASAAQTPLPIPTCLLGDASACYANSTANSIEQAIMSYFLEPDFPQIFQALELALSGDASLLPGGAQQDPAAVVSIPLECGDYDYQSTTFNEWMHSYNTAVANAPSGVSYTLELQIQLGCLGWPFQAAKDEPLSISHPILLVAADFDAYAPMEWANFAWQTAPNSAFVVRHGDDHTSFSLVDQPATAIMKDFLRTGILPNASIGPLVSVYSPDMPQPAILDPYNVTTGALAGDQDSGSAGNISVGTWLP